MLNTAMIRRVILFAGILVAPWKVFPNPCDGTKEIASQLTIL